MPRPNQLKTASLAGAGVFLAAALVTFFLTADIFHPSLDEGIYLEGGHRILRGEAPYRDFFAYTGPLIYWVQALLEAIFGANMRLLRLSTSFSMGLTAAGIYWLALRSLGWRFAFALPAIFVCLRLPSVQHFTVSHRWLSTSLMTMGIALAVEAARSERSRWLWVGAGIFTAGAAWATPTYGIPLILLVLWLALTPAARSGLIAVAGGVMAVTLPASAWLAAHGALLPMIVKLGWAGSRYSIANKVPYGYYPFGFASVTGVTSWLIALRPLIPALMIPLVLMAGAFELYRRRWARPEGLLLLLAFGMLLTTWPRWDVNLLIGVTPPFLVLAAIWWEQHLTDRARPVPFTAGLLLQMGAATLSLFFFVWIVFAVESYTYFPTRVGLLRNSEADGAAMELLENTIPAGTRMLVYPYMPVLGYMLQAENPTSYSYMQPGMMAIDDETVVLGELRAHPPEFILRQYLPDAQVLQVWPGSDRQSVTFPAIEEFIYSQYTESGRAQSDHFSVTILRRRT